MPLIQFYLSPDQLISDEKQELVSTLTAFYGRIMPDFWVNVVFNEIPHGNFFIGGKPTEGRFVRVTADHIAVNWHGDSSREKSYLDWLGGVLEERFESKGWTWEYHVTESNRDLWRVQSLVPPRVGTEAMQHWKEVGKGVPWQGMEG